MRTAQNFIDLSGQKFNRLTVVEQIGRSKDGKVIWLCKCECGKYCKATTGGLKSGNNKSCGCLRKEAFTNRTHGLRYTRQYRIFHHMKDRCYNPNDSHYDDYGGRGIRICDEWLQDFKTFYGWSLKNGYRDDLTIERIDVNGNYEPSNCTWIKLEEQSENRRCNIRITYNGKTQNLKQWADELGMNYIGLYQRIVVRGWNAERAFSAKEKCNERRITFNGRTQTMKQWANEYGIKYTTLAARLDRYHWSIEKALTTK